MLTSTKWTSEQYTLIEQPPESHVSRLVYTLYIMSLWSAFQIYQIVLGHCPNQHLFLLIFLLPEIAIVQLF